MNIYYTTQFKKDYKRIEKQKKDPDKLKVVIEKLLACEKLENTEIISYRAIGRATGIVIPHADIITNSFMMKIYQDACEPGRL